MNKVFLAILASVVFLGFLYHLEANASTFIAVQDGDWDDPDTWGGVIPGASDDKVIPSDITVAIMNPISNSGTVSNSGTLVISNSGTFDIGITNTGTISNSGTLTISNTGGTGISNSNTISNFGVITILNSGIIGILNTGTISNSGTLTISNTSSSGIRNFDSATISNSGTITIDNSVPGTIGILNTATISNSGTLAVNNSNFITIGIRNQGTITNPGTLIVSNSGNNTFGIISTTSTISNSGTLTISNTGGTGIALHNSGILSNSGTLTISNTANSGISNSDTSTISNSGTLTISNTGGTGISNFNSGIISNSGTITVSNSSAIGIGNAATFSNTATIKITNTFGTGISNFNLGVITNYGTIELDSIPGTISMGNSAMISNPGTISNFSTLSNSGTIENGGILANHCGASISNTGTISANPVNEILCIPNPIQPINDSTVMEKKPDLVWENPSETRPVTYSPDLKNSANPTVSIELVSLSTFSAEPLNNLVDGDYFWNVVAVLNPSYSPGYPYESLPAPSEIFTFTVFLDIIAPTVTVPENIVVEATSPSGAEVEFEASAIDDVDGVLETTCSPDSGSTFQLGTTEVTCEATDTSGNTGSASFTVTVRDTTPPEITVLGDDPVEILQNLVYHDAGATAFDIVDGDLTSSIIVDNPVNTSEPGTYTVTYTVSDAAGNVAQETRTVIVTPITGAIEELIDLADSMDVKSNSLNQSIRLLTDSNPRNDVAVCGQLSAFINQVEANKKITDGEKSELIAAASKIRLALGC